MNHSNREGETALMQAARYHENIVHLLLAAGADVTIKDQTITRHCTSLVLVCPIVII